MIIENLYDIDGKWLKGNLHTHTENSSCGHYSVGKVIEMYTSFKMKYDFLSITDHMVLTNTDGYAKDDEIILLSGTEYKKGDFQTLGINIKSYDDNDSDYNNHQELFSKVEAQGGINIICHPHAYREDYWPFSLLAKLDNYTGIEIYNNNVKFDNKGKAVAAELWDKLLTAGKRIYGFANDDMHIFQRCGGAFNIVLAEERSRQGILDSLKKGRFYASTGIFIDKISVEQTGILIELKHKIPAEFSFIGSGGKLLKSSCGTSANYDCNGNEGYVRIEVKRQDGAMAWSQPFWIHL